MKTSSQQGYLLLPVLVLLACSLMLMQLGAQELAQVARQQQLKQLMDQQQLEEQLLVRHLLQQLDGAAMPDLPWITPEVQQQLEHCPPQDRWLALKQPCVLLYRQNPDKLLLVLRWQASVLPSRQRLVSLHQDAGHWLAETSRSCHAGDC